MLFVQDVFDNLLKISQVMMQWVVFYQLVQLPVER